MRSIFSRRNAAGLALLLLAVVSLVLFAMPGRPSGVVIVQPNYYTNAAGIVMAGVRIPPIFELPFKIPFVIDTGLSIFATAVLQTPEGTIEDQSVLKGFSVYYATAEVPANRWRVRFQNVIDRTLMLGPIHLPLPPQTNAVITSELPPRAEILASGKLGPL